MCALPKPSYDDVASDIKRRRWERLQECWLEELPAIDINNPVDISELAGACDTMYQLGSFETDGEFKLARPLVFSHALAWLHRALNVLGGAEVHLNTGYKTWSISSAYQCSFFGARAILAMLGIVVIEHRNRSFVVDVFPRPLAPNEKPLNSALVCVNTRLEHRPLWMLMKRALAVTVGSPWPEGVVNKIKTLDVGDFARQRNSIHYRVDGWIFEDLIRPICDPSYAKFVYRSLEGADFDSDREDSTFLLAFTLVQMGLDVFRRLSTISNIPEKLLKDMRSRISNTTHPKYSDELLSA